MTQTRQKAHLNSLERRGAKAQPPDGGVSGRKRPLLRERKKARCVVSPAAGFFVPETLPQPPLKRAEASLLRPLSFRTVRSYQMRTR